MILVAYKKNNHVFNAFVWIEFFNLAICEPMMK